MKSWKDVLEKFHESDALVKKLTHARARADLVMQQVLHEELTPLCQWYHVMCLKYPIDTRGVNRLKDRQY